MKYQAVIAVCDTEKITGQLDTMYTKSFSISPRLGTMQDVENYLMGKITLGSSFICIGEDIEGIPITRKVRFYIVDDEGIIVKEY